MIEETTNTEQIRVAVDYPNERLVINGFDAALIKPKDKEAVLFLVDNDPGHEIFDTWFGYFDEGKWFGVAEDNEGWQEMAGNVLCWIPFPQLSL